MDDSSVMIVIYLAVVVFYIYCLWTNIRIRVIFPVIYLFPNLGTWRCKV